MIKSKKQKLGIEIDLTGPDGNAFMLIGKAGSLAKQLGLDKDAIQLKGGMTIEKKEDILLNFANGNIKRIITKPKITSFGLNWQHCNHTVYFPTWSYEQYYQSIRRFWRFGQTNDVTVDLVLSDGQKRVIDTLLYKTNKAIEFNRLIQSNINGVVDLLKKEFTKEIIKPKF